MKSPLLLLLVLPLSVAAQMNGSSYGNAQMANNFQRQMMEQTMAHRYTSAAASQAQLAKWKAQREKQLAKQHEAESKATAELAGLARRQDSLQLAQPAPNPSQMNAQQKANEQALAQLSVKNYRDVFLPGQVMAAEDARSLPEQGMQDWQNISTELLDKAWWSRQDPAQLLAKVTAYRATLTSLTTALLGFDPAKAPKAERMPSTEALEAMSAKGVFDEQVAAQFLRETARVEKFLTSRELVSALNAFNREVAEAAARPKTQQNPQLLRQTVKSGLNDFNEAMFIYQTKIRQSLTLGNAQVLLAKYATDFLPKSGKNAKKRAS